MQKLTMEFLAKLKVFAVGVLRIKQEVHLQLLRIWQRCMKWVQENSAGQHLRSACSARDASWAVRVLLIGAGSLGLCPSPSAAVPPASLWEASASLPLPAQLFCSSGKIRCTVLQVSVSRWENRALAKAILAESQEASMATKMPLLQIFSTALPELFFAALP